MAKELLQDASQHKFLLLMASEHEYYTRLKEIIETMNPGQGKICYVCLSKRYVDAVDELQKNGIDVRNFFFIDVFMSHYGKPPAVKNCVFLSAPASLDALKEAITQALADGNCKIIIFDTISTLLVYEQSSSIVQFTHTLVSEKTQRGVTKLFIVIKDDETLREASQLAKDLEMFADRKIE